MKKGISLLILLALLLSGCNLPVAFSSNPTPTATIGISVEIPFATATLLTVENTPPSGQSPEQQTPVGTSYSQNGLSFYLPACMAAGAAVSTLPAVQPDPNGAPSEFAPEHRVIAFTGYPLTGKFFDPQVAVYPVAAYVTMQTELESTVQELGNLLAAHPQELPQTLPFLPLFNAAQVFHARETYLDFQNGSGIAFLAQYAQNYAPANNYDLFYSYQGLTADGKYWVSAILPASANFLQETPDSATAPQNGVPMPDPASPNFENEIAAYYTAVKGLMGSAGSSAFTPELTCLDVFLQSLRVEEQ